MPCRTPACLHRVAEWRRLIGRLIERPAEALPAEEGDTPQIVVRILYTTLGQLARIAKLAQESFLFATVRLMLSGDYSGEELKHPVFPEPGLAEGSVMKVPGHRFPWQ